MHGSRNCVSGSTANLTVRLSSRGWARKTRHSLMTLMTINTHAGSPDCTGGHGACRSLQRTSGGYIAARLGRARPRPPAEHGASNGGGGSATATDGRRGLSRVAPAAPGAPLV